MMKERYHVTTQNQFYPDMSNVNKNITVEAKLINPSTYNTQSLQVINTYEGNKIFKKNWSPMRELAGCLLSQPHF